MSWSLSLIGTPENIVAALGAESERLTGDSKAEFDAAKPHIEGLAQANINNGIVKLTAHGHASFNSPSTEGGERVQTYGQCVVSVEVVQAKIV